MRQRLPVKSEETMSDKIERREDVNPEVGERKYGDVEFADPVNNKYPVDTPEHVRAAWSYINHKDNAAKYAADEIKRIKKRIRHAAKKNGVEISDE
jgi:hypothetical protein